VLAGMAAKGIYIGRIWPAWPTQVRITVGTHDEMQAFRAAFKEVMATNTAGLVAPRLHGRSADHPFPHLS
jgi:histidinol-phosphate aminotransferase